MKKTVVALFGVFAVVLLAWALQRPSTVPNTPYTTIEGKSSDLAALRGKVVLVNFWATTCPGCVREIPLLRATYQRYSARQFDVLSVAMGYDTPQNVVQFTAQQQLPFPVVSDTGGALAEAFGGVQLTPTTILLDKDGHIIKRFVGAIHPQELHQLIDQVLNT